MITITLRNTAKKSLWTGKFRMWFELIHFAKQYGWKPAGCVDQGDAWIREYEMPLGQIVSADEARALADALRRGLKLTSQLISGESRENIRKFMTFCKKGEFEMVAHGARGHR